mmetsp:Transcript_203/g.274  ORF Transcript_203/g.274 Transcript_203/m.274 type:complete len:163 (+) Transcript_203:345-833(+)
MSAETLIQNSEITQLEAQKQEWARQMRLKFTPADMLNADGSLNKDYFKPKHTTKIVPRHWTDRERELLIQGIQQYGISNWQPIREHLLPEWEPNELRLKTSALVGRQSLKLYKGWKGDAAAIEKEYQMNKQIGLELNCWKGGVLVADDAGLVAKRLGETVDD